MTRVVITDDFGTGYTVAERVNPPLGEELTLAGQWRYDGAVTQPPGQMLYLVVGNANVTNVRLSYTGPDTARSVNKIEYLKDGKVVATIEDFTPVVKPFAVTADNWVNNFQPKVFFDVGNNDARTDGADRLQGNKFADTLLGGEANDRLIGLGGDDALFGGNGSDVMQGSDGGDNYDGGGGAATDTVILEGTQSDYVFKGTAGDFTAEGKGFVDSIKNVERISFDDVTIATTALNFFELPTVINGNGRGNNLQGNELDNEIFGFGGNDILDGLDADDELHGGIGRDVATGGAGFDTFFLDTRIGKGQADVFTDFNPVEDTIGLDTRFFKKLGGAVGASELRLGTAAKDTNDYLVYNQKTGNLFYDVDGSGDKGPILIAQIANKASIKAADFDII